MPWSARLAGGENARIYRKVPDNVTAVAEASYRAMPAGRTRVIPGLSNKFAAQVTRITPRLMTAAVAARMNT